MNGKIIVEREPHEKDGKMYQNYFIRGNIRGVDVRMMVVPPDFGGLYGAGYRLCGRKGSGTRTRAL